VSPEAPYRVRLEVFDGPLDLLLHLCRRQEVDVRDIPIATITEQYLQYLDLMKQLDLDVAGSYLAMAATLCHIKSQMMLPLTSVDDPGDGGPDPREDLVRRLLEYENYRAAADVLAAGEVLDRDSFEPHPPVEQQREEDRPVEGNLFLLLDALGDLLARRDAVPLEHRVSPTRYTLAGRMRDIVVSMRNRRRLRFTDLFGPADDREKIVVTFLALLEMVRMRYVTVMQPEHLGPIALRLDYVGAADDLPVPGEEVEP
jgi:segregation and condensation protein A